jgi:cytochrome P450
MTSSRLEADTAPRCPVTAAPEPMPMARRCPFDPPEQYRALRRDDPVSRVLLPGGDHGWLVSRHADVRAVLSDDRFSHRNDLIEPTVPPTLQTEWVPIPPDAGEFNMTDPPVHTAYRRMLARYFTGRRIAAFADRIAAVAAEQRDALLAAGPGADLVATYAVPLAGRVICELLGVPESEREGLQSHIDAVFAIELTMETAYAAITGIGAALARIVDEADLPADGLLADLAERGEVGVDELRSIAGVLVGGGMDTTANMLGLGTLALTRHPDQRDVLLGPDATPTMVDELLRWLTISQWGAARRALADVEVGGVTVREGELVILALNAANRDEAAFPAPDRLDLTRSAAGHVAFGHGPHLCIGQHLARTTLWTGWRTLFAALPDLHPLAGDDELAFRDGMTHYGLHALPVAWSVR